MGMPTREHTLPHDWRYSLWCVLLPLWCKNRKQGKLRLCSKVLIRTVFGTSVVLVGFAVAVVELRNFTGVVIGI